jgi:hypothetical protein
MGQTLSSVLTPSLVSLQPFKVEPGPDVKCKDKFLVQTVAVTPDKEFANIAEIVRACYLLLGQRTNLFSGRMLSRKTRDRYRRRRFVLHIFQQKVAI